MVARPGPRFVLGGRRRSAAAGSTLLEALAQEGLPNVVRSVRYHRPRGPFCGTGDCAGCLVRVNGVPNVRACRHTVGEGDRVRCENSWPGPRLDLLGAMDVLFPGGVDTLHGFRRPVWATRFYQRVIRRLSAYGAPPDDGPATAERAPLRLAPPVVIVGGGTSGRAAATQLVERGVRPLVVERDTRTAPLAGADLLTGVTISFVPRPDDDGSGHRLLGSDESGRAVAVRAPEAIVATGGYDATLLFEGSDRPGVVSGDLAERLASVPGQPLFRRAVLIGGGPRVAELLHRLGRGVRAIVAPGEIRPEVVRSASEREVPLYPRSLVVRAHGRRRVRTLDLRARSGGARFTLDCDGVILAHRRLPNVQLLFQAGARMLWRSNPGAYAPEVDPGGRTSVGGLRAIGTAAGRLDSAASGVEAADALVDRRVGISVPPGTGPAVPGELEGYYRELLAEPRRGKWVACACEDVLLEELERAVARGYRGLEVVKRYTSLGAGLCQGRYCLPDAILLLSSLEGRPPPEVGYITQRPPAVPTTLGALASLRPDFGGEPAP